MPRLVLVQPPVEDFYDTSIRLQPIGLCSLKSAVQQHLPDMEVLVFDFHQGQGRATLAIPPELRYLREYYSLPDTSPFRTFHQYYRFGADYETIGREVAAHAPDIVGISLLFSPYYREGLSAAAAIRANCTAPIIAGGSHVSAAPLAVLAHPAIDYIIRGEGEKPLVAFLQAWEKGCGYEQVPNLGWKDQSRLRLNETAGNFPLDELPMPDMTDLSPVRYLYEGKPVAMLLSSRGCPHRCTFCSVHTTFGRYRRRSNPSIIDEMRIRYDEGYRVFDFEDDNLTFDRDAIRELCQDVIREFRGKPVQLLAMNGVSYRSLDPETLTFMRQAGFSNLNLSLVSASPDVLTGLHRPHPVQDFPRVVEEAFGLGFEILAHQILGLPGESLESTVATLGLLARLPLLIGVSVFYLTPGAPIAADFPPMTATDIFRARSTAMAVTSEECSRDALYTLFLSARVINFVKGLQLPDNAMALGDVLALRPPGERTRLGLYLLDRLLAENILFAATPQGFKARKRFDAALFRKCWDGLGRIRTQAGGWVEL